MRNFVTFLTILVSFLLVQGLFNLPTADALGPKRLLSGPARLCQWILGSSSKKIESIDFKDMDKLIQHGPILMTGKFYKDDVYQTLHGGLAARTTNGVGRKYDHNEDSLLVMEDSAALTLLVADGMGGYGGGDVASGAVVSRFRTEIQDHRLSLLETIKFLPNEIYNQLLLGRQLGKTPSKNMGAVIAAAQVKGNHLSLLSIGDSKGVVIRRGRIFLETHDDSLVQDMVDRGILTPEQAMDHPDRNRVTKTLRVNNGSPEVPPVPLLNEMELQFGDVVLLASDGLWDVLTPVEVAELVEQLRHPRLILEALEELFYDRILSGRRSDDNLSIIVYVHQKQS